MTVGSNQAIGDLIAVLEQENAALTAMDLPRAAALVVRKTAAIERLAGLPASRPAAERLDDLARHNRRLLERAMIAQERVIGIVARAAANVDAPYGAGGRPAVWRPRQTWPGGIATWVAPSRGRSPL